MNEERKQAPKADPEYVFFSAAMTARMLAGSDIHLMKELEGVGPVADISEYERFPELLRSDVELLLAGAAAVARRFGIEIDLTAAARNASGGAGGG